VIVAPVGSIVNGEPVKKAQVGGLASEGMLCDAPMVWGKGSANIPAKVPDDYEPGAAPPVERPRGGPGPTANSAPEVPASKEKPLFEMKQKLSKEEKKAAAEAKKAELAAKKALRKAAGEVSSAADGADTAEEVLASDAQALSLQDDAHGSE
jgi:tRNA-binding EMAP/Myf-like protein